MPTPQPSQLTASAAGGFLAKQVASSLVSAAATQFVVPVVFDALGLTEASEAEVYAQQVMAEMRRIGAELGRQIDEVKDSVSRVQALSIDIQVYQKEEGLAQILRSFNTHAQVVNTHFGFLNNDVQFLSVTDETKNKQALRDLYARLKSPNDANVSIAMRNIHDLVVAPTAADKGILDYLADIVGQTIFKAAPGLLTALPNAKKDWHKEFSLPSDIDYYPASRIRVEAPKVVAAEMATVLSVFRRILATQTKGLMFLTRAWSGGPQEAALNAHIDDVIAEIAHMKGFHERCIPAFNAGLNKSYQQYGKYLTGEITRLPWLALRGRHNLGRWKDVPEGLNAKWIMWDASESQGVVYAPKMVEEPWLGGERRATSLRMDGFRGEGPSFIDDNPEFDFRMPTYTAPAPAELTDMLKNLPATRKQLDDAAKG
jgi:hypothetical protein